MFAETLACSLLSYNCGVSTEQQLGRASVSAPLIPWGAALAGRLVTLARATGGTWRMDTPGRGRLSRRRARHRHRPRSECRVFTPWARGCGRHSVSDSGQELSVLVS